MKKDKNTLNNLSQKELVPSNGSGSGLAVCEEIVTMHGGTLTLENAEGGGTLVTICIPTGEE